MGIAILNVGLGLTQKTLGLKSQFHGSGSTVLTRMKFVVLQYAMEQVGSLPSTLPDF